MAWAADRLLRKREDGTSAMSRTNVRRVFNSISQVNELSYLLSAPNQQDSLIVLLLDAFKEQKTVLFQRIFKCDTGRHSQRHQAPLQLCVSSGTRGGHLTVWLGIYFRGMYNHQRRFPPTRSWPRPPPSPSSASPAATSRRRSPSCARGGSSTAPSPPPTWSPTWTSRPTSPARSSGSRTRSPEGPPASWCATFSLSRKLESIYIYKRGLSVCLSVCLFVCSDLELKLLDGFHPNLAWTSPWTLWVTSKYFFFGLTPPGGE